MSSATLLILQIFPRQWLIFHFVYGVSLMEIFSVNLVKYIVSSFMASALKSQHTRPFLEAIKCSLPVYSV